MGDAQMNNNEKQALICDKCGAENWNLARVGLSHNQQANEVKGYDACDGVWCFPRELDADRQPGKLILFPARQKTA
jgi:hypothetical protein